MMVPEWVAELSQLAEEAHLDIHEYATYRSWRRMREKALPRRVRAMCEVVAAAAEFDEVATRYRFRSVQGCLTVDDVDAFTAAQAALHAALGALGATT